MIDEYVNIKWGKRKYLEVKELFWKEIKRREKNVSKRI